MSDTYDQPDEQTFTDAELALEENAESARVKEILQPIVDDLARYGPGRDAHDLVHRLSAAIAEAGLPEQPHAWVEAVAAEASYGRRTVLDSRFS
jgi:hypothetical protein